VSEKNAVSNFCNNFINCLSILKIISLMETAMNYLQNTYNVSRQLLKTSLHHRVKHKSLKKLHLINQSWWQICAVVNC